MLSLVRATISAATIGISAVALSPIVHAATPVIKPPAMAAINPDSSIVAAAWHGGWSGGPGWGWRSGWRGPGWGRPGWGWRGGWGNVGWRRGWGYPGWRGGWGWRRGWVGPGFGLGWGGPGWGYAPAYYGGYNCAYGSPYGYGCGYPYAYGGAPVVSFSVGGWGW